MIGNFIFTLSVLGFFLWLFVRFGYRALLFVLLFLTLVGFGVRARADSCVLTASSAICDPSGGDVNVWTYGTTGSRNMLNVCVTAASRPTCLTESNKFPYTGFAVWPYDPSQTGGTQTNGKTAPYTYFLRVHPALYSTELAAAKDVATTYCHGRSWTECKNVLQCMFPFSESTWSRTSAVTKSFNDCLGTCPTAGQVRDAGGNCVWPPCLGGSLLSDGTCSCPSGQEAWTAPGDTARTCKPSCFGGSRGSDGVCSCTSGYRSLPSGGCEALASIDRRCDNVIRDYGVTSREAQSCQCSSLPYFCPGVNQRKKFDPYWHYFSATDHTEVFDCIVTDAENPTCSTVTMPPKSPVSGFPECNVDCAEGATADSSGSISCYIRKTPSCEGGGFIGIWPHVVNGGRYTTGEAERFVKENCVDVSAATCKAFLSKYFNYGYAVSDRFKNWKLYNQRNYR